MNMYRVSFVFLAVAIAFGAIAQGQVKPHVVNTFFPAEDVVIASVIAEAPKDGNTDGTAAIQAAIDGVAAAGGGVVFVPAGRYRLEGGLVLKESVTLRGDWAAPTNPDYVNGTILMPVGGRGDAEGVPAITIEHGAGLREVVVWYPEQKADEIVPYPWTLRTATTTSCDNVTVQNVTLVNPYQAFKTGPEGNELHTLRNVYGTPLKTGIWIDTTTDIGRVISVNFRPNWWEESGLTGAPSAEETRSALRQYLLREAVGVDMGRSDWQYLYDLQIAGYGVGIKIREGQHGTTNAVLFGCQALDCATALLLEKLNGVGVSATGCRFSASEHAVHAPVSFDTIGQFNACEFGGSPKSAVLLEGSGALTFQGCRFATWMDSGVDAAAGKVALLGCRFEQEASPIRLGQGVKRARILGNQFTGTPAIANDTQDADVMIAHPGFDFETPDTSLAPVPVHPKPANDKLFVVSDYGASVEAADDTKAFTDALTAARDAGGGTVYVPGGYYRFAGQLIVPTGVELRGSFDVPHHTQNGGSILMTTANKGDENGAPFIRLDAGAGIRGLTIWYPEQDLLNIAPYPWAIQALGPRCWVLDTVVANAYQGVDFWTYPSDGHVIRYLSGAVLKRGLFVSKCDGEGWVEDVQFNPHYAARLPVGLPRPKYDHEPFNELIAQQRQYLEGLVFGRCNNEHLTRNFLYAAYDGIAFRDDGGGANARIINHGTDTGSRAAVIAAAGEKGLQFINAQLVPLGDWEVGALIVEDTFKGKAQFFNTQMWAGHCSGIVKGAGDVLIQQLNTLSGPLTIAGGRCTVENVNFDRNMDAHIAVEGGAEEARLTANAFRGGVLNVSNTAGDRCRSVASSASLRPKTREGLCNFATGWEEGEPQGLADTVATEGGNQKSVSGGECHVVDTQAHSGKRALRVAGTADDPAYSYVYFKVFDEPLQVNPGAKLSYWFMPANERGRNVCVDVRFDDGTLLRELGVATTDNVGMHPGAAKGTVGKWKLIRVSLERFSGEKAIASIMFAYDSRSGGGPFEAFVDDLKFTCDNPAIYQVKGPGGALVTAPYRVELSVPAGITARYTLDGFNPSTDSPAYKEPIVLEKPGRYELRYSAQLEDGSMSGVVFAEWYEFCDDINRP